MAMQSWILIRRKVLRFGRKLETSLRSFSALHAASGSWDSIRAKKLATAISPGENPPIQLSPASGRKGKRERQSSIPAGEGANESLREFHVDDSFGWLP